jgi:hypothetical protein
MGVLIMRKLIATVFNYSLDGLLADEGTEFWKFCFDLPAAGDTAEENDKLRLGGDGHIVVMGGVQQTRASKPLAA